MADSGIGDWVKAHPAPSLLAVVGGGVLLFVMLPKGGTTVNPPNLPTSIDQNDYATKDQLQALTEAISQQLAQTGQLPHTPPMVPNPNPEGGPSPWRGGEPGGQPGGEPGGQPGGPPSKDPPTGGGDPYPPHLPGEGGPGKGLRAAGFASRPPEPIGPFDVYNQTLFLVK